MAMTKQSAKSFIELARINLDELENCLECYDKYGHDTSNEVVRISDIMLDYADNALKENANIAVKYIRQFREEAK